MSIGFFAFCKGQHPFFARKTRDDLVHYCIPEGFFVKELVVQRTLRHPCCGQNDVQIRASKS